MCLEYNADQAVSAHAQWLWVPQYLTWRQSARTLVILNNRWLVLVNLNLLNDPFLFVSSLPNRFQLVPAKGKSLVKSHTAREISNWKKEEIARIGDNISNIWNSHLQKPTLAAVKSTPWMCLPSNTTGTLLDPCLTPAFVTTFRTYSTDGKTKLLSGVILKYSQPDTLYKNQKKSNLKKNLTKKTTKTHPLLFNTNWRPSRRIQQKQHINTDSNDDSQFQTYKQTRHKCCKRWYQINF